LVKLREKYSYSNDFSLNLLAKKRDQREAELYRNMTTWQILYKKFCKVIEVIIPYIRVTRIIVTYIAPLLLMIMYLIHKSYRTKRFRKLIRNFKSDRAFLPSFWSSLSNTARQQTSGILELT